MVHFLAKALSIDLSCHKSLWNALKQGKQSSWSAREMRVCGLSLQCPDSPKQWAYLLFSTVSPPLLGLSQGEISVDCSWDDMDAICSRAVGLLERDESLAGLRN